MVISLPPQKVVILLLSARLAWKQLQIGINMLHIIINNNDDFFRGINIDDLKPPWISTIMSFSNFFAISSRDTHIKSKLRRNG